MVQRLGPRIEREVKGRIEEERVFVGVIVPGPELREWSQEIFENGRVEGVEVYD